MGRIERRIVQLEASSGERAVAKIEELFGGTSDQDLALILADARGAKLTAPQEKERGYAEARLQDAGVEALLELALRPESCASEEEMDRRIDELVEKAILTDRRRGRLSRLVYELEEQGA